LQKLRAASLILDAIEKSKLAHVYSAIEHIEDVYLKDLTSGESQETFEEDKYYDHKSSFTLNSKQVLNTFVSFLDCYINKGMSTNIFFGFYATNNIGKEANNGNIKSLGISLPSKPLLKYLQDFDFNDQVLDAVKKLVMQEYSDQYKKRDGGHLDFIETLDNSDWVRFLERIRWEFGQPDNDALEQLVLDKIRNSRNFSPALNDSEDVILAQIINLFDKRQGASDPTERFIHASDIVVIFLSTNSGAIQTIKRVIVKSGV